MIPDKKKNPEEIASLREGLGIRAAPPESPLHTPDPHSPCRVLTVKSPADIAPEPVIHLDLPDPPPRAKNAEIKPTHSLRKHDLPLAPAPISTHRTELPTKRHDLQVISQIRKRETLAALNQPGTDPTAHIRKQTASPFLHIPGYLLAIAAAITTFRGAHYITPAVLIGLAIVIMVFIALRKPRSRHHAALLFIIVFLTLVFGALHYAPLFQNGP